MIGSSYPFAATISMIPSSILAAPLPLLPLLKTLTLTLAPPFLPRSKTLTLIPHRRIATPPLSSSASPAFHFEEIVEKDWSFLASPDDDRADKSLRIIAAAGVAPGSRLLVSMGTAEFVDRVMESVPCELVVAVHESLLELALVKEMHDGVRCWQGGVEAVPERFEGFDAVWLCYLPGMGVSVERVLGLLAVKCAPGARVVISSDQGKGTIRQHRLQFPDMVTSDLPDRSALEEAAAAHSFHISEFVDEPTFYLAVLRYYLVKTLVKFRSRHNFIRVLDVSRRANHPLAGSRLLLLDSPGNIHSLSFLFDPLTSTYFDVFATLPPLLPPGPLAILGFGAGTAARIILHLFPDTQIHGWELDPSVISVAREYFGLAKLEKQNPKSFSIYIGDALTAEIRDGFAGILVDLFSKGSLIPELQEAATWEMLKRRLRRGGRMMVNCGGSCVEAEDESRDGEVVMVETLKTMREVFAEEMFVLNLGHRREDSCVALTGPAPDVGAWKEALPVALRGYVHQWSAFNG